MSGSAQKYKYGRARETLEFVQRVRWYQRPLHEHFVAKGGTRAIEIAHRRWGKDEIALSITRELAHRRPASYWHCLPEYEQGRKALWSAVNPHTGKRRIDEAFPPEIRDGKDEQSMFIRLKCGSTWQIVGSDRYNAAVGAGPAGIVMSEWALANPASWGYFRPMVEENGGWALFITTPRGRNHAHAMYEMARKSPRWFAEVSTVHDTGALSPEQIAETQTEYAALYGPAAGQAQYEQEYECSFNAATLGAIYGSEMARVRAEGRISDAVAPDPRYPVYTAWDLGVDHSTAIWWFQVTPDGIMFIDYYAAFGAGFDHFAEIAGQRGWGAKIDFVPHDARVMELGTGKTRVEQMISVGFKPQLVPGHKIADGVAAVRRMLPRCHFNETRCAAGIEALEQYANEWSADDKAFNAKPGPKWALDPADAFRYAAMAQKDLEPPPPPKPRARTVHEMSLDELWKMNDDARRGARV